MSDLAPYELYCQADKFLDNKVYEKAALYYELFLNSGDGSAEAKLTACDRLAGIYGYLGNKDKQKEFVLKSFEYDIPHAEFCCRLGYDFLESGDISKAIYWYKLALSLETPADTNIFYNRACWTWLPNLQLCVCYYRLGDKKIAYEYIKEAYKDEPGNQSILKYKSELEDKDSIQVMHRRDKPLRIVQVAPDVFPCPPENYGGIERVVYDLTEELVRRGHEIYLYAAKGSRSKAKIINYTHEGVNSKEIARLVAATLPDNVDIIHDHTHASVIDALNLPVPTLCTIHDSRKNTARNPVYLCKKALANVGCNKGFSVYNGIDLNDYEFCDKKEDYLLYLGVLNWHKGINYAIDVAETTGQKLIIAGPVFNAEYFNKEIRHRISNKPNISYIGEVGGKIRQNYLKYARCMLFPTSWEEPFGLVMIEAMACGTPVLAFPNGAVPEVLSGFPELICNSTDAMVRKVLGQPLPNPASLREYVTRNFSAGRMADCYLNIYEKIGVRR